MQLNTVKPSGDLTDQESSKQACIQEPVVHLFKQSSSQEATQVYVLIYFIFHLKLSTKMASKTEQRVIPFKFEFNPKDMKTMKC